MKGCHCRWLIWLAPETLIKINLIFIILAIKSCIHNANWKDSNPPCQSVILSHKSFPFILFITTIFTNSSCMFRSSIILRTSVIERWSWMGQSSHCWTWAPTLSLMRSWGISCNYYFTQYHKLHCSVPTASHHLLHTAFMPCWKEHYVKLILSNDNLHLKCQAEGSVAYIFMS